MSASIFLQAVFIVFIGILLIANIASFIPQIRKLHSGKSSDGPSVAYVVINLIAATYHVVLAIAVFFACDRRLPFAIWSISSLFVVTWLGNLIIFVQVLILAPKRIAAKVIAVAAYTVFLFITVDLVVTAVRTDDDEKRRGGDDKGKGWAYPILFAWLVGALGLPVMILQFLARWPQKNELVRGESEGALSIEGLQRQAIVSIVTGVSCAIISGVFSGYFGYLLLTAFPILNLFLLAVVQDSLAILAKWRVELTDAAETETAPLLGGTDGVDNAQA